MTPRDDFLRLDADISFQNAQKLKELQDLFPISLTEHVRRAVAIYTFAVQNFTNGGSVHGVTKSGPEIIPLFYAPDDVNKDETKVHLSVNINKAVARALEELGLGVESEDTGVLDNVINYYGHIMTSLNRGSKLVVVNADGSESELVVSGAL